MPLNEKFHIRNRDANGNDQYHELNGGDDDEQEQKQPRQRTTFGQKLAAGAVAGAVAYGVTKLFDRNK